MESWCLLQEVVTFGKLECKLTRVIAFVISHPSQDHRSCGTYSPSLSYPSKSPESKSSVVSFCELKPINCSHDRNGGGIYIEILLTGTRLHIDIRDASREVFVALLGGYHIQIECTWPPYISQLGLSYEFTPYFDVGVPLGNKGREIKVKISADHMALIFCFPLEIEKSVLLRDNQRFSY